MDENNKYVNGNRDAVAALEAFLEIAKHQPIGYVAIVACEQPNKYTGGFSGTVELEHIAKGGLDALSKQIEEQILNRTAPDPDPSLDASYVCYNITKSPLSYDFVTWMLDQEMTRIREGAPFPLKVGFWYGRDGKTGMGSSDGSFTRQHMLDNVCRPALELIGAVEDPIATKAKFKEWFSYRDITKAVKEGEQVPKLIVPSVDIPFEPGYITLTLREANHWPHRNSKYDEWLRFAKYLRSKGERVIFVRDTSQANNPIEGFDSCPEASKDMLYRVALYSKAKANFGVANGPMSLCFFMDRPFRMFAEVNDGGSYNAQTSGYWEQCAGIKPPEQFPWLISQLQAIAWKTDVYTNLVLEWEDLNATLRNQ